MLFLDLEYSRQKVDAESSLIFPFSPLIGLRLISHINACILLTFHSSKVQRNYGISFPVRFNIKCPWNVLKVLNVLKVYLN